MAEVRWSAFSAMFTIRWNPAHIAGGSSGGSAAAVAAGLCYAAIGTDTAGSIREPAALCGCVGIKPTYGRVSARGVIPLSWSLDHVGPLAATVGDAAVVLQAIAGYDALDACSADVPASDYVSALARRHEDASRRHSAGDISLTILTTKSAPAVEEALAVIGTLVAEVRDMQIDVPTDRTVQTRGVFCLSRRECCPDAGARISRRRCGAFATARIFPRRNIFSRRRELG